MDNENRDVDFDTPVVYIPSEPEHPPFSAPLRDILIALAMFVVAYVYTLSWGPMGHIWLAIFGAAFIVLVEWRYWDRPRSRESWVWLGCLVVILASHALARNQVFSDWFWLISHAFAIYWVLSRAGMLSRGESSTFLPMDALNGVIVYPFYNLFLRIRTLWYAVSRPRKKGPVRSGSAIFLTLGAVFAAFMLLYLALRYLASANLGFAALTSQVMAWLTPDWNDIDLVNFLGRLVLSLPVGAYLFSLICGAARTRRETLDARTQGLERLLNSLRQVSSTLWNVLMAIFATLYLVFFLVQLPEMLGGFTRTLPEGLTVAEYARQGFFSLCRVLAVNFILLWLVTRTGAARDGKLSRILVTVLLAQSLLFAVIAASKLGLYIDCFGFTPKRLQSAWLIVCLFGGCAAWPVQLWSNKKTFKVWLMASGILLSLLHLY